MPRHQILVNTEMVERTLRARASHPAIAAICREIPKEEGDGQLSNMIIPAIVTGRAACWVNSLPGRISPGISNSMKVSEIMSREPVVVAPGTTLRETAQLMRDLDVGMIPVCDGNRLQGTITDRDIAIRGVASQLDPTSGVDEVMTKNVLYCFEDDPIEKAAKMMEEAQVRRLVVLTSEKELIGILSLGDLATRTEERTTVAEAVKAISEPAFH